MPKHYTMKPITPSLHSPLAEKAVIHLIAQELKSRKFFEGLRDLGLDDAFYQADLLEVVMSAMGLPPEAHEHQYDFYHDLLRKHSARVAQDADELFNEARCVYDILVQHAILHTPRNI
jgi:hypothetical protein